MKPVKTIAAVGVAPTLLEELREAVEAAAAWLESDWRWGSDQNPDLLMIDPSDFGARMARTRAQVTGVRYVVVGDAAKHATDRFVLLRPYRRDAVAAVLNAAGSATVAGSEFMQQDDSFYTMDFEASEESAPVTGHAPEPPAAGDDAAQGLDEVMRGDPLAAPVPAAAHVRLPSDVTVQDTGPGTQRSEARREQVMDRMRRSGADSGEDPAAHQVGAPTGSLANLMPPDTRTKRLEQYLAGELLGGPARVTREGAPALTLDPKLRMFHAEGDLVALVPYCREDRARGDWQPVSSGELQAARQAAPGRPYLHLQWLCALLRSHGRIASHLDPGGTYHVAQAVEIDPDFHAHGAIAEALSQPLRLHEIAAASGATMEQVFDVVNAYDATGLLEWTPRAPRHAMPAQEETGGGLLARLARLLRGR